MPAAARIVSSLPRPLLPVVVLLVALSVLGMHQLSVDHMVATPDYPSGVTGQVAFESDKSRSSVGAEMASAQRSASHLEPTESDRSCPGCGGHDAMIMTCLLALTLLVVGWLLIPPRSRWITTFLAAWWVVTATVHLGWRRPALTLAELSLRRS
jgi:hypothetical protein